MSHEADINLKDNAGTSVLMHAAAATAADENSSATFLWVVQQPGQLTGLETYDLNRLLRLAVFGVLGGSGGSLADCLVCAGGSLTAARFMLEYGADPSASTSDGYDDFDDAAGSTVLMLAATGELNV